MESHFLIAYLLITVVNSSPTGNTAISSVLDSISKQSWISNSMTENDYNEDVHFNFTTLVTKYGYSVEEHKVTSCDGYKLTLFRIPCKGPVVVICHGLLSSSDDFVSIGPQAGLIYQLANAGFDAWSVNFRGNKYSLGHDTLSMSSAEYWDYSFDEMGRYDLPAHVDYILKETNAKDVKLIGHSQGTNVILVFLSERPEYNDKVSLVYFLGATAFLGHNSSPGFKLISGPFTPDAYELAKSFGVHSVFSDEDIGPAVAIMKDIFCGTPHTADIYCKNLLFILYGDNHDQVNKTSLPVIFGHFPTSTSVKSLQHYAQLSRTVKFQQYDYGSDKNLVKYQCVDPPEYPVEKITTKFEIAWGEKDQLMTKEDLQLYLNKLPNVINVYKVPDKHFTHSDYILAKDCNTLIYNSLIESFKNN